MKKNVLKAFGKVLSVAVAAGVLAGIGAVTVQASELTVLPYESNMSMVFADSDEDSNFEFFITLADTDIDEKISYDAASKTLFISDSDYSVISLYEDGLNLYVNDNVTISQYMSNADLVGGFFYVFGNATINMNPGTTLAAPYAWVQLPNNLKLADGVEMTYDDKEAIELNGNSYASYTNVVFSRKAFSPEVYFAAKFDEEMSDTANAVLNAADGVEVTVDGVASIPNYVMQSLVQKSTVSMTLNFTYEGEEYQVVIPAGSAMDNDIPWYGPLYLMGTYGYTKVADGTFVPACHPNGVGPDAQ